MIKSQWNPHLIFPMGAVALNTKLNKNVTGEH